MKINSKKLLLITAPVLAGGLLGYAYYYFIGCYSGTCPITSNPFASIAYGSIMGALFVPQFSKSKKEKE